MADHLIERGWGTPTERSAGRGAHWWHAPSAGTWMLVILSDEPIRYRGHWRRGSVAPCRGATCPLCAAGSGWVPRYVLSVQVLETRRVMLWEIGASTADQLLEIAEREGGLRGVTIEGERETQGSRGKIIVRATSVVRASAGLPDPLDAGAILSAQWA
jgi:hypothetical protein